MNIEITSTTPSQTRFATSWKSPLSSVSDAQWARFVRALDVQSALADSEQWGLGSFGMKYRRLCELGLVREITGTRGANKVYEFVVPLSLENFLRNPVRQYAVFCQSTKLYYDALVRGEFVRPVGMSLAGALAILHCGGRGALASWPKLFDRTRARFEAAQGAF